MAANISVEVNANLLPAIIARFPGAVDAVLSAATQRGVEYAVANHPWQNQTGETEASIHSEHTGPHEWQLVSGGASIFLEWGTVHMPPFPFIRPAYDYAIAPAVDAGLAALASHL